MIEFADAPFEKTLAKFAQTQDKIWHCPEGPANGNAAIRARLETFR
jgi:hypothetical protein